MLKHSFIVLISLLAVFFACAQENELSSDELFQRARQQAFTNKNYPQAIRLSKLALTKSPDYHDISIFLGRLYTWNDKIDSARMIFNDLDQKNIPDEDFYLAYASAEYWNENPAKANSILDKGLSLNKNAEDLLLLKTKVNYGNDNISLAKESVDKLLQVNPKNSEARSLSKKIQDQSAKNAIGLSYNFVHFDKQFEDNWHIIGLQYKRQTGLGSVIFRTNYANKFADNGVQFEVEAYPRISKIFYMYVGAGYSDNVGIFPKYRTGVSLYANLPKSFEGEIGYRQLYFSDNLFMYTASISKYVQNFWLNFRTFITPSDQNISHSYTATARYYTGGMYDYIGFLAGTGISPDDNRSNLLSNDVYKMKTYKLGLDYNFSIKTSNLFNISATYYNQEFRPQQKGNQFDINIGYIKTF